MNRRHVLTAIGLVLTCLSTSVMAGGNETGKRTGLTLTSMRQLAMGGAGIAITFDEHALYKNPAGLKFASHDFDLPSLRFAINQDALDKSDKFQDLLQDDLSEENALEAIESLIPLTLNAGFSASPILSYTLPGFGVGAFSNSEIVSRFVNPLNPKVEASVQSDVAGFVGGAIQGLPVLGENAVFGLSVGYIYTVDGRRTLESSDFADGDLDFDLDSASGIGFNAGLLFDHSLLGTTGHWGFAFNNIGNSDLSGQDDEDEDVEIPFASTVGIGMNADLPILGKTLLAADYAFISEEDDFFLNTHLGAEKEWGIFTIRGGVNQGYIVGGFGVNLWIFQIDYAVNTRELGEYPGDRGVTQHLLQVSTFL